MTPETIVDQLLATGGTQALPERIAALRAQVGPEVVALLKRRVDQTKLRNARRALEIAEVAMAVAQQLADPATGGLALWARGNARYHLSRYQEALADYRQAELVYIAQGRDYEVACLQINQVAVLQDTGAFAEALALAARARQACAPLGAAAGRLLAILEMNSGAAYQQLARPTEALAAYERGRALLVGLDDPVETARIDINRANVLQELGRFAAAAELYGGARAALAAAGVDQEVARADHNLGKLAYRRGHYQQALRHLEAAHAGFAAIPNPTELAKVDLYRALIYRDLNLLAETVALATAAGQTFARERTAWELATALTIEGSAYARLGDPSRAAPLLDRARRLLRRQGAHARLPGLDLDRAALALAAGNPLRARRLARNAAGQIDPAIWPAPAARAQLLLADCALAGPRPNPGAAQSHAGAARDLAARYGLPELALAHHACARAHEAAGATQAAYRSYRAALVAAEELRARLPIDSLQLAYREERAPIYRDAARLALRDADPVVALAAIDLALSAPSAASAPSTASAADLVELRERWSWLERRLDDLSDGRGDQPAARAELDRQRRALETQLADLALRREVRADETQTSRAVPQPPPGVPTPGGADTAAERPRAPASLRGPTRPDPLDPRTASAQLGAIQAQLTADAGLLAYTPHAGQMDVLLVTRSGIVRYGGLIELGALERLQRSWRFHIEHTYSATTAPAALAAGRLHLARFYNALLGPLGAALADLRRLSVVAPPEWHDLPLAAAYDGREHLIERLEVSWFSAPSALIGAADTRPTGAGPALVVGCSDAGRLPAALAEAAAVAEALRGRGPVNCLLESQANLAALYAALPGCSLAHLASHAAFRPDNPLFSWVRLADGQLTVADLGAIRLAERPLVVLSACETGRGRPFGGGLLGMGRGLLRIGASALVLSLWKIADRSSARLMADFYTGPAVSPAAALARAQRAAIARGEHPFHWAAFICVEG